MRRTHAPVHVLLEAQSEQLETSSSEDIREAIEIIIEA